MKPLVTNAFGRLVLEGEGAPRTEVVIQATRLPQPAASAEDRVITVLLPGFALNMPPATLPLLDGVVQTLEVKESGEGVVVRVLLDGEAPWEVMGKEGWPAEIILSLSHLPLRRVLGGRTILVDPAHGGRDAGARGPVNLLEKDVVLDVARRLARHLESLGTRVLLTRETDRALTAEERWAACTRSQAACLLHLHTGHEPGSTRGFRTLFPLRSPDGRRLALALHRRLAARLPLPDRGCHPLPSRRRYPLPAALVEAVNLAHPLDEAQMRDVVFKERAARALLAGLKDFLAAMPPDGGGDVALHGNLQHGGRDDPS